jgi:hypothetical protein
MAISMIEQSSRSANPLDMVEQVVTARAWPCDRLGEDELSLVVETSWSDLQLTITWCADLESLQLACALEMKVPPARRQQVHSLLALINERLWLGHFDLWSEDQVILYRHGLPLQGGAVANAEQCETIIQFAIETCERFYPAFQYVLWGGKSPEEAIAASLIDCAGEA